MNIALIGPSGVGKGTHAERLIAKYDMVHLATGELFRENLDKRTALGLLAKKYMSQDELVPDEVVSAMIEECILKTDPDKGILFDGFPRTRYQAMLLEEHFEETGRTLDAVIYLKVPDEEVVQRLSGRLTCRKCPRIFHKTYRPFMSCDRCDGEHLHHDPDLTPERVRARLRVFHRVTGSLLYYYQSRGKLFIVDGQPDIEQVYQSLIETVGAIGQLKTRQATLKDAQELGELLKKPPERLPAETAHPGLDLVLLGGPGSGKGTQAEKLRTHFEIPHIATGDLFRENLNNKTELGQLAKTYMDRGELVPDDVTEAMVQERLSRPDTGEGFILDGFPRTLAQAEALTEMMNDMNRRLSGVLYINVSDEEIVRRLSGRVICKECQTPFHKMFNPFKTCPYNKCSGEYLYQRDDDNPETIRARLKTYHGQTAPLIDFYQEDDSLVEIPGEGDLSEVAEKTITAAEALQ